MVPSGQVSVVGCLVAAVRGAVLGQLALGRADSCIPGQYLLQHWAKVIGLLLGRSLAGGGGGVGHLGRLGGGEQDGDLLLQLGQRVAITAQLQVGLFAQHKSGRQRRGSGTLVVGEAGKCRLQITFFFSQPVGLPASFGQLPVELVEDGAPGQAGS